MCQVFSFQFNAVVKRFSTRIILISPKLKKVICRVLFVTGLGAKHYLSDYMVSSAATIKKFRFSIKRLIAKLLKPVQ